MARENVLTVGFGRPLTDDAERSHTLPSRYYTDPAIYELEKERIFYRSWTYLCPAAFVAGAGDFATGWVADQNIAVVRGRDGALRAFYNVCQHRAHELLAGRGNLKAVITCPYHAWAYGLDGELRTARGCDHVKGFDKGDFSLKQVRVEELLNLVFVNLDPEARPLAEQVPHLEADIRGHIPHWDGLVFTNEDDFGGRPMDADWKVVVDNYVECYHCGPAHPAFSDMIEMACYEHTIDGITAKQLGPKTKGQNTAYSFGAEARTTQAAFWYLWPTTTINVLPGPGDVNVTRIVPRGSGKAAFVNHRLAVGAEPDRPERREYLLNVLAVEDLLLCESVQRGLNSRGYDQGRFIVDQARTGEEEHVLHFFHKKVLDALSA